ncbi:MAG: hypothetical protein FK730_02910 [Asgard group archaeon]|nr:hypothetical protein [Asgard group archaeon]
MVSQIIISHENSTSFFSIGSVQDDATLVSALGGALASFAVEMGLSDTGTTQANYSKFQNGILISKWLEINNYNPSLMIAIRGYENLEEYQQMFLVDYGTLIAKNMLSIYEKYYQSEGAIPKFKEAIKYLPKIANELFNDSPNTLKEFASDVDSFCNDLLTEMWNNQKEKGTYFFKFRSYDYHPSKINQIKEELLHHYYQEGARIDALFPLRFASTSDMSEARKYLDEFLKKQSENSRNDLALEISTIVNQLQKMSRSRSRRGKQSIASVDLLNAAIIFGKLAKGELSNIDKIRLKVQNEIFETLLQKLYQRYPLKFISAGITDPIDITFIKKHFEKATLPLLKSALDDTSLYSKQISAILRDVATVYTPEEAIKNSKKIISKVESRFLNRILKNDPFIILADIDLQKTRKITTKLVKDAFNQYRTAHDEAMALYYIVRQVNQSVVKLKTISFTNKMRIFLLQSLIRKYQFRYVPKVIYNLSKDILSNFTSSSNISDPVIALLQRNLKQFQENSGIEIPEDIRKIIFNRIKTVKSSLSFENIEALSYFSKAISAALELTIINILETLLGSKNSPQPPKMLSNAIEKIIFTSQSLYTLSRIIQTTLNQPGRRDLLSKEAENIVIKELKLSSLLPIPLELAKTALDKKWFQEVSQKSVQKQSISTISNGQFLAKTIQIPTLNMSGKISTIIKNPKIAVELYKQFFISNLLKRQQILNKEIKKLEQESRTTAGTTTGKKKFIQKIRNMKSLVKSYTQLSSGGNFFQKYFMGKKDLKKLIQTTSKEKYPELNFLPQISLGDKKSGIFRNEISVKIDPMIGDYQRVVEVYASTWVMDSAYIGKLKEEILWRIIEKNTRTLPLERKIIHDLQQAATKGERLDQETIVRTTIEEEVCSIFYQAVQESITLAFNAIKDDLIVRIDSRTKEFYIVIDEIDVDKKFLQPIFDKLNHTKIIKKADNRTEIRLILSTLLPNLSSRKRKAQPIRGFIRDGLNENLRSYYMKTLNSLGDMIEQYVGEQASNLFYSKSQILEQLILESIDQT